MTDTQCGVCFMQKLFGKSSLVQSQQSGGGVLCKEVAAKHKWLNGWVGRVQVIDCYLTNSHLTETDLLSSTDNIGCI